MLTNPPPFLKHFIQLESKYRDSNEIHLHYLNELKSRIKDLSCKDSHYKYHIYVKINPDLKPSDFINDVRHICSVITKFRLGSHRLPIETGRWSRIKDRADRICKVCKVPGDEMHLIYNCNEINRSDLNIPINIDEIWKSEDIITLFKRIESLNKYFNVH